MADQIDFPELLKRMPEIAKAVNAFESSEVQMEAFTALVEALGAPVGIEAQTPKPNPSPAKRTNQKKKSPQKAGKKKSSGQSSVKMVKDLDLRPKGKKAFEDFAAEKQAKSNQDRVALIVYWLEQIAGVGPITAGHVATVFRRMPGWHEPKDVRNTIHVTATRKHTVDSSDADDLKTTAAGRNFVDHKLPPDKKK